MKKLKGCFFEFLRTFMYLCFIVTVSSIFVLFILFARGFEMGYTSNATSEQVFKITIGVFLGSATLGFLIRDFLKKHEY